MTGGAARKPLIIGNWKMHNNHFEAIALTQKLGWGLKDKDYVAADIVDTCRRSPRCAASRP